MAEIEKAIKAITRTPQYKERVCEYIQNEVCTINKNSNCHSTLLAGAQDYIKGMIDVMTQSEDLESLDNLHALCSCMQTICAHIIALFEL